MSTYFEKHKAMLDKAIDACQKRYSWTGFTESPSSKLHGKVLPVEGERLFKEMLGCKFEIDLPGHEGWVGDEVSPFTNESLGIQYPKVNIDKTFEAAIEAQKEWCLASVEDRVGLCLEMLSRCGDALPLFVNAHATMHTAGQSYVMAFAGCGANALDRGLEALSYAYRAMKDVPSSAVWERGFGGPDKTRLEKRYRLMPRGVGVVITCATFPQWNGYPAIIASLATGNPVVVKPHPNGILPIALCVKIFREVLKEGGFNPDLVTMVADTRGDPVTKALLQHKDSAIIDFTGSPQFGEWIERNCNTALVYTETAGCNSVVVESTDDLKGMASAIAHSLCQASAQMCTSVQNIYIPAEGVDVNGRQVSFESIKDAIVAEVDDYLSDARRASTLCGALVSETVLDEVSTMRAAVAGSKSASIARDSAPYAHPDFDNARTATPLIVEVDQGGKDFYGDERFGPISFLIRTENTDVSLELATQGVREKGAITSHVYTKKPDYQNRAELAFHFAGASVAFNLMGMPINFAAAYSDYHVTGLTRAGNACLTDLDFVSARFRIVQSKWISES